MRFDAQQRIALGKGYQLYAVALPGAGTRVLGEGVARGWCNGAAIGATPGPEGYGVYQAFAPAWVLMPLRIGPVNQIEAGGDKWIGGNPGDLSGMVPHGYGDWSVKNISRDGTIVMASPDGTTHRIFWPDGHASEVRGVEYVRACVGYVLYVLDGALWLHHGDGLAETIATIEATIYGPVIEGDWIFYQAPSFGYVGHRLTDRSQGYQWPGVEFHSPDVCTLNGETHVAWCVNEGERPEDLRRNAIRLGEGMRPFVPMASPPIPVPAHIRNGWFGLTDANPLACGNTAVGWYDEDPRPCVESAPWLNDAQVAAHPAKLLGIIWSPLEAPGERDAAVRLALKFSKPILVYCDAPVYKASVVEGLKTVRRMGADALPFVQAYPATNETADESLARIRKEVASLIVAGEDRIALWRYARYGAFPEAVVDALLVQLTDYREQTKQIVYDVGFRKLSNLSQRIFDYYARSMQAMRPGVPPPLYRPIVPNPVPPDPGDDMPLVSDEKFQAHALATAKIMQPIYPPDMTLADVKKACENDGNRSRSHQVNATHEAMGTGGYAATRNERPTSTWPTPMVDQSQAKYWDALKAQLIALDKSEGLRR